MIGFPVMIEKPPALTKKILLFNSTGSVCYAFNSKLTASKLFKFLVRNNFRILVSIFLVNFVFLSYYSHLYDLCLPWNISIPRLPSTLRYNFPAR